MNETIKKIILWAPRVLMILFALFLGMFSLDAFSGDSGFWLKLAGFLIHNIPTAAVAGLAVVGWKWPKVGGYIIVGLAVLFTIFFDTYEDIFGFLLLTLPLLVIAGLFLAQHYLRIAGKQQHTRMNSKKK